MSPVLLWSGSSFISPIGVPSGVNSTNQIFWACRENTAKFIPSGIMVAPSCIGEPGAIEKRHFAESETVFMFFLKVLIPDGLPGT